MHRNSAALGAYMADDNQFDPIALSEDVGKILSHTSAMMTVLNAVRGDVEDVRASVNQLYDRVTAISGGQQTLRSDFHTLLEANMKHDREIRSLWHFVFGLLVITLAVGFIAIYAAMR